MVQCNQRRDPLMARPGGLPCETSAHESTPTQPRHRDEVKSNILDFAPAGGLALAGSVRRIAHATYQRGLARLSK